MTGGAGVHTMPPVHPLHLSLLMFAGLAAMASEASRPVRWKDCLRQPAGWYGGAEAMRIAETVLAHQRTSGGWPKNVDWAARASANGPGPAAAERAKTDSTIDNGATVTELRFLARVQAVAGTEEVGDAIRRGVDYLLGMQYANGGWPQFWPAPRGYAAHITFNDGAMVNVLKLLREVAGGGGDFAFLDGKRRDQAREAVRRGVECLLRCQVVAEGRKTVWCAQHDERTLAPAAARSYEHPSLSGAESVGIVRFLMELEPPEPRVIDAVEAAVAWFEQARLEGIRVVERPDASLPKGYDRVVLAEAGAPPVWARFYDLKTGKPVFSGRDGAVKERLADIEHERRVGYAWYTDAPASLLAKDVPAWRARINTPPGR